MGFCTWQGHRASYAGTGQRAACPPGRPCVYHVSWSLPLVTDLLSMGLLCPRLRLSLLALSGWALPWTGEARWTYLPWGPMWTGCRPMAQRSLPRGLVALLSLGAHQEPAASSTACCSVFCNNITSAHWGRVENTGRQHRRALARLPHVPFVLTCALCASDRGGES